MDSSAWKAYGKIDPELEAMLPHLPPNRSFADMGGPEGIRKTIAEQIEQGFQAGIFTPADFTGVTKGEVQITTRDGSSIRGLTYRPESGEPGPLYIYFHGGGWVFGPPESYENGFAILTKELGFSVLSVDYRLAPEHLFPTGQNDAFDSVKWAVENASKLGADPVKGLILGGSSAGGNLATVATRESIDQKLSPPVTGLHLNIPSLVHPDAVPEKYKPHYTSEEEFKDALILDRKAMTFFYDTAKFDPQSKYASPLTWPSHGTQHPATWFQVCGMDPLRDEALIYESILREEGVPTRLNVYAGLPHAGLDILPMLSQSKQALKDLKPAAEWLLSQKSA